MFCPSCGNEITVELKYCNRCGANLTLSYNSLPATFSAPIKLTGPTVVLGLTIVVGLGIIFGGVTELAKMNLHPGAITWIVLFSMLTLFGCTALLLGLVEDSKPAAAEPRATAKHHACNATSVFSATITTTLRSRVQRHRTYNPHVFADLSRAF